MKKKNQNNKMVPLVSHADTKVPNIATTTTKTVVYTAMLIKCIYSPYETSRKAFCCLYLHLSVNQLSIKSH